MLEAWRAADADHRASGGQLDESLIKRWHALAMPHMVKAGVYRLTDLTLDTGGRVGVHWSDVPRKMRELVGAVSSLSPSEFYKEFLDIHCFYDGNGRTAKIVYNYLLDSLHDPQLPPKFWPGD